MITRSRTRVKASAPAAPRRRPPAQASRSRHAVAKLLDQLAASTSTPCAEAANNTNSRRNRKSSNSAEAADAGAVDDDDDDDNDNDDSGGSSSACLTPKGKRFRIPEISSCPPAPKKMRTSPCNKVKKSSSRSNPIAFFSPPELELLFFLGVPSENNISVI